MEYPKTIQKPITVHFKSNLPKFSLAIDFVYIQLELNIYIIYQKNCEKVKTY